MVLIRADDSMMILMLSSESHPLAVEDPRAADPPKHFKLTRKQPARFSTKPRSVAARLPRATNTLHPLLKSKNRPLRHVAARGNKHRKSEFKIKYEENVKKDFCHFGYL